MKQNNISYPQYPEYKASNVEWIKEIPKHWDVWKTTHGFNTIGSGTTPKSDNSEYYNGDINWITTSELRENEIFESKQKITDLALEDYSALELYPPDSIIIAMYGATIGRLGILKTNSTVNQACCVLSEPKAFKEKFFFYWLQYRKSILISLSVGGGQPNLSQDDLKSLRVPLPPLPEQKAIATFLDHQTTRIDQLIEKKKRILDLLDEQRQATITRAVTKGIDPNAKKKDSGIEWLGEVPEHWDVTKVKFTGSIKYGLGEPPEKLEGGLPFIRATDIYRGIINSDKLQYINPDAVPWSRKPELKAKDILVVRSGAYTGDSAIVPDEWEGAIAGYDMVYTSNTADPEFVANAFLSKYVLEAQFHIARSRAAQPHLNAEELGNCMLLLPPMKEQKEIVTFLKKMTTKLDYLKSKIIKAINHLEEYRSSLITQAVTGKIDVRNEVTEQEVSYAAEEGEAYTTN